MESIEQQINLSWEEIFNSFQECNACQIEEETEQAMPVCDPVPSAPTTPVVTEEKAKVKVYNCRDKWYGMTYADDLPAVNEALNQMIQEGFYDGL